MYLLSPYLLRTLFWLGLVPISLLAGLPVENPSLTESYADKVNHVACFLVLLPLLWLAYRYSLPKTALLLFGYGLVIEAVQLWLPWRKFSLLDLEEFFPAEQTAFVPIRVDSWAEYWPIN